MGVATDIHEQKMREQHQAFLADLNTRILPLSDPDAILWTAVNRIGPYLKLNRCHFGDVDMKYDRVTLHRSYLHEAISTVGAHAISAFGPPAFVEALQQGRTVIVNDAATDPLISAYYEAAYRPMNVRAYITVPCLSAGRFVAALIVDTSMPHAWTPQEVELLETVAHRIWLAVENSRLYQQAQVELKQRQAAQEALQAERERLGAIIAEMPAGVMLLSADGKLLLVNREAERIYDVPDLMAVPEEEFAVWKVFRPDGNLLLRHEYPTMRSLTNGETVRNEEYLLERRDGTRIPLLVNSAPLRDATGRMVACILTFSDIMPLKEIEAALRASEALYRTIGESGPDYVWSTDATGTPNYVSRAWEEYTRGPAEKIGEVGKSFLHPSHFANFVQSWEEAKANGSPFETEFLYRRHDGVYRWFMARAVPVKDEQGNIPCWVGTTTDIHKRKMAEEALQQSEERLRSLVDVLTAVVWTTDGTGAFVTPQIAWERYTGQPWEEHRGAGWAQMLYPDDRARIRAAWEQTVVSQAPYRIEGRLWHAGSQRYRHFIAKAVSLFHPDGTIREWVGTVEDVEDTKHREEEILALNAHLRLGIQETHHRVKNNLQVIAAMMDMHIADAEHALPLSEARRIVSQVQMLAKIHDILTVEARFDRFGDDISSRLVLERLLPVLQTASGIHGIQLKAEIEEMALTVNQATSLALVVNELVSNAIKYGRGRVEVIFMVSEGEGMLQVKDNGDGFPESFDFRTDAKTGLLIVEQIVRHDLRGNLRFATRPDHPGAEVCITFPRSENLQKSSLSNLSKTNDRTR
jgi:PAS domain S-box-containing protein